MRDQFRLFSREFLCLLISVSRTTRTLNAFLLTESKYLLALEYLLLCIQVPGLFVYLLVTRIVALDKFLYQSRILIVLI